MEQAPVDKWGLGVSIPITGNPPDLASPIGSSWCLDPTRGVGIQFVGHGSDQEGAFDVVLYDVHVLLVGDAHESVNARHVDTAWNV